MAIVEYQPSYDPAAISDLHQRLARTRWPDTISGSTWEYGFDRSYLQRMCDYWRTEFDWKAQIEHLSALPHYQYIFGGQWLHFVHVRGAGRNPTPILLLHGWPGSFLELLKLVPLLTDPASQGDGPCFDLIVPSLPGFGFSSRPSEPGMNTRRMAELFAAMMSELGYERFGAHGGDFGAGVSSWLARRYPARVLGIHLNYIPGSYMPGMPEGSVLPSEEQQFLRDAQRWDEQWGAYAHLQHSTPLTAAYGLNDSPAALAAWILEKFRDWADCDDDLEKRFTWDELLANVTLYWVTETIHSSCRLYLEGNSAPLQLERGEHINVPCGIAHFPKEAPFPPRSWIERGYNVVHWTEMESGGHFAAMEEPEALARDIRTFFRKLRAMDASTPHMAGRANSHR